MIKDKYINKECKTHGLTSYVLEGRGYYRCRLCRLKGTSGFIKKLKIKAVEYMGGKCSRCNYSNCIWALEFHHLNPSEKEFTISGTSRGWDKIKDELDKCVLVCANCHREIHGGVAQWQRSRLLI